MAYAFATMLPMNRNRRPLSNRAPIVSTPVHPVPYRAYPAYPVAPVARPIRRRSRGWLEFLKGWLIGFVGGGLILSALLLTLLILAPPRRTNVLLLGLDRRPQEETTASRTDTMILMT